MSGTDIRDYIPEGRFLTWLNNPYRSESASQQYLDNISQHGCWCAKLDKNNPFKEFLGGPETVDDLDEICKLWFQARNANDRLSGGFCRNEPWKQQVSYHFSSRPNWSGNVNQDWGCVQMGGNPINTCAKAACEIDIYYMKQIREWMRAEYNSMYFPADRIYSVVDNTTCTRSEPPENLRRKSSSLGHPFNKITSHFQQEVSDVPANAGINELKTYGNFSTYGYADNGLIISEDSNRNKIKVQLANEYSLKFMLKSDEGYGNWYHNYRGRPRSIIYIGLEDTSYANVETDYYSPISGFPSIHFAPGSDSAVRFRQFPLAQNTSELPTGGINYPTNTITPTMDPEIEMSELLDNDWHEIEFRTSIVNIGGGTELYPDSPYTKYMVETFVDGVRKNAQYLSHVNQANADGNQYAYIYASGHDDPDNDSLMRGIARVQVKDLTYTHLTSTPGGIKWWPDSTPTLNLSTLSELQADGYSLCPSGTIAGKVMVFNEPGQSGNHLNWHEAKAACEATNNGATLFSVLSQSENDCLLSLNQASMSANPGVSHGGSWFGLNDEAEEDTWVFTTATGNDIPATFLNWNVSPFGPEPTNDNGDQHCGSLYTNHGKWDDQQCWGTRGAWACGVRAEYFN